MFVWGFCYTGQQCQQRFSDTLIPETKVSSQFYIALNRILSNVFVSHLAQCVEAFIFMIVL